MTDIPDLDPVPTRIPADVDMVRGLIASQFPQWFKLPVSPVANEGWDNRTFHLGRTMVVRLPSAAAYALAVEKEQRWLPIFAPQLPLPIPVPIAQGKPDMTYPHPWSVYGWLQGRPTSRENVSDLSQFGAAIAGFLAALQRVDPTGGPSPGQHNWFRGGPLATYDKDTRSAIEALHGHIPSDLAIAIWQTALSASWDERPVWFHGDVATGNLLENNRQLAGVIDFGTCGVGDPSCDLAIAWTLLSGDSRKRFRDRLSVDDATWARGRGWAIWKALVGYAHVVRLGHADPSNTKWVLDQIFAEFTGDRGVAGS